MTFANVCMQHSLTACIAHVLLVTVIFIRIIMLMPLPTCVCVHTAQPHCMHIAHILLSSL